MWFHSQTLWSSNILGALVRFVIGWHPVLGTLHTLVDVVANQIVGFLWRRPLDQDGGVRLPRSNHLTGSGRDTWGQEFQSNSESDSCRAHVCSFTATFELLSLNRSSRLWRIAVSIDIGRQNSELILFALRQVKDCVTRGSNGDLSIDTLPGPAIKLALRERDRDKQRESNYPATHIRSQKTLPKLVFRALSPSSPPHINEACSIEMWTILFHFWSFKDEGLKPHLLCHTER